MSQGIHTRSRTLSLAIAALVGLALALVGSPAWAHDELIGSSPAAGSQVDALPSELTLTFSGVLLDEPGATEVVVTDAAGTDLTAAAPVLDGTRLTQELQGEASGTITVIWRVVSSDGHPVSDEFTFAVGEGATAPTATASPTAAPDDPLMTSGADLTWVWFAVPAVLLLTLLVVVLTRLRPSREH